MATGRCVRPLGAAAEPAQRFHLRKGQRALQATAFALEALFPSPGLAMGTERAQFE